MSLPSENPCQKCGDNGFVREQVCCGQYRFYESHFGEIVESCCGEPLDEIRPCDCLNTPDTYAPDDEEATK